MPAAEPARARREGPVLYLAGRLDRAATATLWPAVQSQLAGVEVIDLAGVDGLDSAGVALLAELAARIAAHGPAAHVSGEPPGLAELRAAYRMDPTLDFAGASP